MSRCFLRWTLQFSRCSQPAALLKSAHMKQVNGVFSCVAVNHSVKAFQISPQRFSSVKIKQDSGRIVSAEEENAEDESDDDGEDQLPVKGGQFLLHEIPKLTPLTPAEWESFKKSAFAADKYLNDHCIDSRIMAVCCHARKLAVAVSFLQYLIQSGRKPNQATVGHFMHLCYACRDEVDDEIKQSLVSFYKDIRSEHSVFDAYSAEHFIIGLSITDLWKEGLKLLEMIKVTCTPNGLAYNALIKAGFDNNEPEVSERILTELSETNHRVRPETCHAWLDYCDRSAGGDKFRRWKKVEEFLHKTAAVHEKPSRDVAEKLNKWHMEVSSSPKEAFTSVSPSGVCQACRSKLERISLSEKEFITLRDAFLQKVVAGGKDAFVKTTPAEIQKFSEFVQRTAPYTFVIDALNTAHSARIKDRNQPKLVYDVVKYFVSKSEKMLLVGRKHMANWPRQYMDYIRKNSHVFFVQDLSQDDPFLLYAALYSGMGTKFLSRDLMRGHAFLLQDAALRSIFRRWQMMHQYQLKYITQSGKVVMKFPVMFSPVAQVDKEGNWHVPYEMEFLHKPPETFDPPPTWLCLQAPASQKP